MKNKQITTKDCYEEMERLLKIWLYQTQSQEEDEIFKKQLKHCIETKGRLDREKQEKAEERRADRVARSYGIKRNRRVNG